MPVQRHLCDKLFAIFTRLRLPIAVARVLILIVVRRDIALAHLLLIIQYGIVDFLVAIAEQIVAGIVDKVVNGLLGIRHDSEAELRLARLCCG